jgi:SAM-dependent methyltransferase
MDASATLTEILAHGYSATLLEDNIYSVLPAGAKHHYDRRSTVYDLIVSTRLYNSLMWGSSPRDYSAFAREAVCSSSGRLLDAGCGSMLFTAAVYLESAREIIAFDQSLAMLRRARERLIKLAGSVPERILLLQADLSALPFRPGTFETALFMNVLHQFEGAGIIVPGLKKLLKGNGGIYLTSLISNRRLVGDYYLKTLHATGEFVRPRTELELKQILAESFGEEFSYLTHGNMAFATGQA